MLSNAQISTYYSPKTCNTPYKRAKFYYYTTKGPDETRSKEAIAGEIGHYKLDLIPPTMRRQSTAKMWDVWNPPTALQTIVVRRSRQ
jgi:hypothetical protein